MNLSYDEIDRLVDKYGESFYLFDSETFKTNYREMLEAFQSIYPTTRIAYSYKTNYTPRICSLVNELGGFAEIVSEMELWLAFQLQIPGSDIYFNGPYKKKEHMEELMLAGGHVNLDADYEIAIVEAIAAKYPQKTFSVGIRSNVDIGQEEPSRFGLDVESGDLADAIARLNSIPGVQVNGLHCHIPFRDLSSFEKRMIAVKNILKKCNYEKWEYISLGGGYMGKVDEQLAKQLSFTPPKFKDYATVVAGEINKIFANTSNKPLLIIEPGSALVANTFQYVTRVLNIKKARDKTVASLTGSTYQMNPSVKNVTRPITVYHAKEQKKQHYENLYMAGYTCIEADFLCKDYCGDLAVGDYVVFDNVGSYSVVMKPPFILPDIPIIELDGQGKEIMIKRPQTPEDVFTFYN